jgi:hypothetical protein
MSHRVETIIGAVLAAVRNEAPSNISVFSHRALSLSEQQGQLPAISIEFGEDRPFDDDGASNMAFIDSLLTVNTVSIVAGTVEVEVKARLLDLRHHAHKGIMSDRTLGLAFVADVRYQGANEPEFNTEGQGIVGSLTSSWAVHYRMNITD